MLRCALVGAGVVLVRPLYDRFENWLADLLKKPETGIEHRRSDSRSD
jgi:hypothetical protein